MSYACDIASCNSMHLSLVTVNSMPYYLLKFHGLGYQEGASSLEDKH